MIFPRSAAEDMAGAHWLHKGRAVCGGRAGIFVRPAIFRPFPDISVHVVQSECVGRKTSNRQSLLTVHALPASTVCGASVIIRLGAIDRRSKRKGRGRRRPRRIFPFRLRCQAVRSAGRLAEPRNIGFRIIPADADHGMLASAPSLIVGPVSAASAMGNARVPLGKCDFVCTQCKRRADCDPVLSFGTTKKFACR